MQTAISEATPLLPPGMPSPPSFRKSNPADQPIMFFGVTSSTMPLWDLDEYAETMIAQRISMVNGVAQVGVMGPQKYAVHVQVDPRKLLHARSALDEVANGHCNWNINLADRHAIRPTPAYNVQANGQLMKAADYRPMVVAWRNGAPVRLEQVAHVIDSVEDDKTLPGWCTRTAPRRAINLMVMRQPGSNTIEVTDDIKKLMPIFRAQLPPAVDLQFAATARRTFAKLSSDIQFTMMLTLALVISVIFLFLRNVSATLIPSMALPFSIVGTFAVMYAAELQPRTTCR